jgi:MoxR-like ATPase
MSMSSLAQKVIEEVSQIIVGKKEVLEMLMMSILSGGHVLIEDYPGLAKTMIARSFSMALGLNFKRVQFTSDLLPADITGSFVLNRNTSSFELRRGPIFTNILLADEINRAPPRTQSALLEAMQERQVTVEGETIAIDPPFIVIATQNPIEYEGTYPLPEAQLDRFLIRLGVGYPSMDEEVEILERRNKRGSDDIRVSKVTSKEDVLKMQEEVEGVHVEREVMRYIVYIVAMTRSHREIEVGSSPRGSLAIMKLSKASAWLSGRNYVIPDDVKKVTIPALSHRLILKPEVWLSSKKTTSIIEEILNQVPVPKVE